MFTNRFKCLVGGLVVLFLFGLLAVTSYNQEQQIRQLQEAVAFKVVVTPVPTVAVTVVPATPEATLKPVKIIALPKVSPVTVVK